MKTNCSYTHQCKREAQLSDYAGTLFYLLHLIYCYRIVFFKSIFSLRGKEKSF